MKTIEKLNRTQRVQRSSRTGVLFPVVLILIFWNHPKEFLQQNLSERRALRFSTEWFLLLGRGTLKSWLFRLDGILCVFPTLWYKRLWLQEMSGPKCNPLLNSISEFLHTLRGAPAPWHTKSSAWMFHPGAAAQGPETKRAERRWRGT